MTRVGVISNHHLCSNPHMLINSFWLQSHILSLSFGRQQFEAAVYRLLTPLVLSILKKKCPNQAHDQHNLSQWRPRSLKTPQSRQNLAQCAMRLQIDHYDWKCQSADFMPSSLPTMRDTIRKNCQRSLRCRRKMHTRSLASPSEELKGG